MYAEQDCYRQLLHEKSDYGIPGQNTKILIPISTTISFDHRDHFREEFRIIQKPLTNT